MVGMMAWESWEEHAGVCVCGGGEVRGVGQQRASQCHSSEEDRMIRTSISFKEPRLLRWNEQEEHSG